MDKIYDHTIWHMDATNGHKVVQMWFIYAEPAFIVRLLHMGHPSLAFNSKHRNCIQIGPMTILYLSRPQTGHMNT